MVRHFLLLFFYYLSVSLASALPKKVKASTNPKYLLDRALLGMSRVQPFNPCKCQVATYFVINVIAQVNDNIICTNLMVIVLAWPFIGPRRTTPADIDILRLLSYCTTNAST